MREECASYGEVCSSSMCDFFLHLFYYGVNNASCSNLWLQHQRNLNIPYVVRRSKLIT